MKYLFPKGHTINSGRKQTLEAIEKRTAKIKIVRLLKKQKLIQDLKKNIPEGTKKRSGKGYLIIRTCEICNKKFWLSEHKSKKGLGKYCSKKCYAVGKIGYKQPTEVTNKIVITKRLKSNYKYKPCAVCGKLLSLNPYWFKKRRTCSRDCMGILVGQRLKKMWENPPDGLIEKLRVAAINRRKRGRINKETKPEKVFREELERRNLMFEQQFGFGNIMIADFYIPSLQAFIFVDGSYWHNLPSSEEKDWQQVEYAKTRGMKAYRFTDKQIFEDVSKCVDEVLEDAKQPLAFGELIDKFTILGIKTQFAAGEKLTQVLRDYRRMNKLLISGIEYYKYTHPERIIEIMKSLLDTNIRIFLLIDKIQKNKHTKRDSYQCQQLNIDRSKLINNISEFFNEKQEVKI